MQIDDEILIGLLACGDAIFRPCRAPMTSLNRASCEARIQYRRAGVPWATRMISGGRDEAGRKEIERVLTDLASRGLVDAHRAGGQRLSSLRLSDLGDRRARCLAGLPTVHDVKFMIPMILSLPSYAGPGPNVGFVPEIFLLHPPAENWSGKLKDSRALGEVELLMLPLLVRGFCESNGDSAARALYAITNAGREAIEAPRVSFKDDPKNVKRLNGRCDFYFDRRRDAREQLARERVDEQSIGQIPMSCSALGMLSKSTTQP
jgi:DNA-binding PadR family transcriptional regulator